MQVAIRNNTLSLVVGDITKQTTDFIVNAANGSLLGGGGVDGAIHRTAGSDLLEANKQIRKNLLNGEYLPTGEAVVTKGFNLPAKYVIHTVGPVWENKGTEHELLANCYRNSLSLAYMMDEEMREAIEQNSGFLSRNLTLEKASQNKTTSIAFPSISTGVYRFPIEEAAKVALTVIYEFLKEYTFGDVSMTLFADADFVVYEKVLREIVNH